MLIMMCVTLAVTYFLALRVFKNREIGLISIILTSTVVAFYGEAIEVRPDVPQTLTGLLSIYFLFSYYDTKSVRNLIISSIFLAISFLFLQKAIALIIPMGILFLYDLYNKKLNIKDVSLYAGIFILTILPYYIYLLLSDSLEKYFVMNWILNMHIRETQGFSKYFLLLEIFRENMITCMLYAIGIIALIRSNQNRQFAILSLLLLASVLLLYNSLWKQYFLFAIPLIGIIASYALYTVFGSKINKFIVIIVAIYTPLSMMHDYSSIIRNQAFDNVNQMAQLEKINYALSITDENDKIYDGNIDINLFRDDIDYFWFCVGPDDCLDAYRKIAGYEYDIYELISKHRPKVINTFDIENLDDTRIKNYYRTSGKYDDVMIRIE